MDHHHGGHEMHDMCSMNMLFNTDWRNLCVVFEWWHIRSFSGFVISLLAIIALGVGYEGVREVSRRYETGGSGRDERRAGGGQSRTLKAFLYATQVFYSFFIMLLFMTYNLWIMLAVAAGAFVGYILFGGSSATKSVACH